MKNVRRAAAIRKLLDLCDDLLAVRTRLKDVELPRDTRGRLRRQLRTKTSRLSRELTNYRRFQGPLGVLLREFAIDATRFQVLVLLLHRHLRSDTPAIEGRAVLASLFVDSFDVLAAMELLQDSSVLRVSGLVVLEDDEESAEDILESRFRISEDALDAFQSEIQGLVVTDRRKTPRGYASAFEHLADLRILQNLYKHRSERIFQQGRWDRIHAGPATAGRQLTRRIASYWERMQRRLGNTTEGELFPAARFAHEHQLTGEELMIVVHLLFKELFEGNAYADAAELVRLVDTDDVDLVRNRRLMQPGSALVDHDMIKIESMIEGREMTGEVYLADWAVNFLLGASARETAIGSDDRLDWHLYLKNLEDTQSFFRDMEKN